MARGIAFTLFAAQVAIMTGCTQARYEMKFKGKPAPDFELASLEGELVRLSDFRGKPVLLTFWALG